MKPPGLAWLGIGGVAPGDHPSALLWERRLHWFMIGVALLSLPGIYLEELGANGPERLLGVILEWFILAAFVLELGWMLHLSRSRRDYLARNWLDVMIIVCTSASIAGFGAQWVTLVRLARIAIIGLLLMRAAAAGGRLFRKGGLPYLLLLGVVALLFSGFGFYWIEPTVKSYGDGLWLAFVTGATIGYGDLVPTTPAARFFAVFIVVVGVATMSMVTASIAALLIGEDERRLRQEMHEDIRSMRQELGRLITTEERALTRELHRDVRELRAELARLRDEVRARHSGPD
ncbi:MAG: ion channel [Betaproteobacteria bacterium]|jgi:voltage-gated potassium channel